MLKALDIIAGTNGEPSRDWSAEFLTLYNGIRARGDSVRTAGERKRIAGTRPSLALSEYAGTYTHPAWGTIIINDDRGVLHARIGTGANNTGPLEHWHYDTFHATLGDGRDGATTLQFVLGADGKVARLLLNASEDYAFVRTITPGGS